MKIINLELTEGELKSLFICLESFLNNEEEFTPHYSDTVDTQSKIKALIKQVDPTFFKTVPYFAVDYLNNDN